MSNASGFAAEIPTISQAINRAENLAHLSLPDEITAEQTDRFRRWSREHNAVLLAHYYTPPAIQQLALETDGVVADSLEMARAGRNSDATTLIVSGVRFMGETAKILSPNKRVLMFASEATCSLDIGCPPEDFARFLRQHPNRTVVVYANTSAAVKAMADWVVTSSIAVDVVEELAGRGEKIVWAPDRHLGHYVQERTGADMVLWDGACVVHEEFRAEGIRKLQRIHPEAGVLAHPESPAPVLELADAIGSTSQLVEAARSMKQPLMIVATDRGLFHSLRRAAPEKEFIAAPTQGKGATCRSCARCPWMALNSPLELERLYEGTALEITVDEDIREKALMPLRRMVEFSKRQRA